MEMTEIRNRKEPKYQRLWTEEPEPETISITFLNKTVRISLDLYPPDTFYLTASALEKAFNLPEWKSIYLQHGNCFYFPGVLHEKTIFPTIDYREYTLLLRTPKSRIIQGLL